MLTIGDKLPAFSATATVGMQLNDNAFTQVTNDSYKGKWLVMFFWPKDFTFVCPTEIAEFGKLNADFADRDAQVLGVSVDNEFVHLAWKQHKDELKDLPFPMIADVTRQLSADMGVLDKNAGVAMRATFIADPDGIIRYVSVTDMNVGRNVKEVLRVLDALQTDELCPCNWQPGQETIDLKKAG
jgi:peroxiredoxin (alkyl hydroperoxide reductase subunit C)